MDPLVTSWGLCLALHTEQFLGSWQMSSLCLCNFVTPNTLVSGHSEC